MLESANPYSNLVHKINRAIRGQRGCQLSYKEMLLLLHSPAWAAIQSAEWEELKNAHPIDADDES